jgi:hypothetical protein
MKIFRVKTSFSLGGTRAVCGDILVYNNDELIISYYDHLAAKVETLRIRITSHDFITKSNGKIEQICDE